MRERARCARRVRACQCVRSVVMSYHTTSRHLRSFAKRASGKIVQSFPTRAKTQSPKTATSDSNARAPQRRHGETLARCCRHVQAPYRVGEPAEQP